MKKNILLASLLMMFIFVFFLKPIITAAKNSSPPAFTADSRTKYSFTIKTTEGGTVPAGMADTINGYYVAGAQISLPAREMPGYKFVRWESSNGGVFQDINGKSTTFTMPVGDVVVTGVFEVIDKPSPTSTADSRTKYSFTIKTTEGGTVPAGMVDTINGYYVAGAQISLPAREMPGYKFVRWESSNGGVFQDINSKSTTFTMPVSDVVVTGVFEVIDKPSPTSTADSQTKYSFTIKTTEGGTVPAGMADTINGYYVAGAQISLPTREMPGYKFVRWESSNGGVFQDINSKSTTFTMPAGDVVVTGVFEATAEQNLTSTKLYEAKIVPVTTSSPNSIATPGSVKAVSSSYNSIKVSWGKVSGASGYQVYRSTSKGRKYFKVKSTTSTNFTNKRLKKGKTYYYKVRAYRVVGKKKFYGDFSSVKKVKLKKLRTYHER